MKKEYEGKRGKNNYCPRCKVFPHLDQDDNQTYCLFCGEILINGTSKCNYCKNEIPLYANFCPYCRARVLNKLREN
jgi:hypothetical protein